ncbi:MAG: alpha/beta fold hydrolase [Acidimicrobiales bacterium]
MDRASSFGKVTRRLHAAGHDTMAYDRRGYASAVTLEPAKALMDHVDDLWSVVESHPIVVIGHSYGGDVALLAAATRPEQVLAVAAYETPMPWMPWWPADTAGGQALSAAADPDGVAERFMRRVIGDRLWERLPERTRAARRAEGPALVSDMQTIRSGTPIDLTAIECPVVAARGSASVGHHRETAARLAEATKHGELFEIDGAEHGAHNSHPDEFADLVLLAIERGMARRAKARD